MKSKIKFVIPLILIILIGFFGYQRFKKTESTEKLYSAQVEATNYDLAFEIPGKIRKYHIKEGQTVKKGDLLVTLDEETIQAELKRAEAGLAVNKATLKDLLDGARPEEIKQARAQLEGAKAQLRLLEQGPTIHEIDRAKAAMLAAQEQYKLTRKGYRKEDTEKSRSAVEAAKSNLANAEKDYVRYKNLYKQGAAPGQVFDRAKTARDVAKANYDSALENYRKMKKGFRVEEQKSAFQQYQSNKAVYENLLAGSREESIAQARSNVKYWESKLQLMLEGPRKNQVKARENMVEETKAQAEAAKIKLGKTKLYAPADGTINVKNFENQEMVGAGVPVISLADLAHPWVNIYIPETMIGKVKLGDKAKIRVDSYPDKTFMGEVVRIYDKAEYTPKFIQTRRERVNLVFRIKINVENPENILKPGMPADVEFVDGK